LETDPAHFENQAIPNLHLPNQLGIYTDSGITQNPYERGTGISRNQIEVFIPDSRPLEGPSQARRLSKTAR
jgi:hypothetical protein